MNESNEVSLEKLSAFLSKQDSADGGGSLEGRANCAISLLQSLPCARYAVLEKLGEVFFDDAKHYVIETERQHVAGLPIFNQFPVSKQAGQIQNIQHVILTSIDTNPKAWAPMIFQWAIQTLSQLCNEYGDKRHFAQFTMNDRFMLWLDCNATKVLLEIVIASLRKIIEKNQLHCLKVLLNSTLACTPYLDWAFAHLCYVFYDILPYNLLHFALESFSNQSRRVEVIIDTLLAVFKSIFRKNPEMITKVLLKVFKESFAWDEDGENNHTTLCIIPFLLHICTKSPHLFLPLVDDVITFLNHDNLTILSKQSRVRESVLQRGLLRRIVDVIKLLDRSAYNVTQFIFKYAFKLDEDLNESNKELANEMQNICYNILEYVLLHMTSDLHGYLHKNVTLSRRGEAVQKIPLFHSLSDYSKQLCGHILHCKPSIKQKYLELLIYMALQEGESKMIELLEFCLLHLNAGIECEDFELFYDRFQMWSDEILESTIKHLMLHTPLLQQYTPERLNVLFNAILFYVHDERKDSKFIPIFQTVKFYVKEISQVLFMSTSEELTVTTIELLRSINFADLRISDFAILTNHVLKFYFDMIRSLTDQSQDEKYFFKDCDRLLVSIVNECKATQQLIIRAIIEFIVSPSVNKVVETEPEESLIKVELLKKNNNFGKKSRFTNSSTAVDYRDGLSLAKRKSKDLSAPAQNQIDQYLFTTLSNIVTVPSGFTTGTESKSSSFAEVWLSKENSCVFPSTHASLANVLFETVCPEINAGLPWPEEDFLKYTIERDLKITNIFRKHTILWNILELISKARPSLYYCSVIIHSLFGASLKYWHSNRNTVVSVTSPELKRISRLFFILKLAGWLPKEFESITDIFHLIKPKEVYNILSAIWKYLKLQDFAPDKFMERDCLGRPQIITVREHVQNVQSVIKIIFLKNIGEIGEKYHRFISEAM